MVKELRCPDCGRLLAKAHLLPGSVVEIMCRSKQCKGVIKFQSHAVEK